MRLTETLVAITIFLISSAVFAASLVNVGRCVAKSESASRSAVLTLKTDALLRKEIKGLGMPYWKNFDAEFKAAEEEIELFCARNNIELVSVFPVYDKKHRAEGIKVEWRLFGKSHKSLEFIKQRIVDDGF